MKLKKRLSAIQHIALQNAPSVQHIWDTCCDHGHLGFQLLDSLPQNNTDAVPCVHFVDIVPDLITTIEDKLHQYASKEVARCYQVHCLSAAELPLSDYLENEAHLIIIAGVGGELLLQLVQSLVTRYSKHTLEFILCPVHHAYALRDGLNALGLGLIEEQLLEENKRFYEILQVSNQSREPISLVGEQIWLSNSSQQSNTTKAYLSLLIQHYQRKQDRESQSILNQYQAIDLKYFETENSAQD